MKYVTAVGLSSDVNKEIEEGAKVVLIVPLLRTDNFGSYTAGYNVLFEKEEEENWKKRIEDEIAKKDEEIKSLKAELNKPITFGALARQVCLGSESEETE